MASERVGAWVIGALVVLVALWFLTPVSGFVRAAEKAESEYEFVSKNGTPRETCEAALKVKQAWQERQDARKFNRWSSTASTDCLWADTYHGR